MKKYKLLPVYENGVHCNYCIGTSELDYNLESMAFADYLQSVRKRATNTIISKMTAICYWHNYILSIGKPVDSFFTLNEQLQFIKKLESVPNRNHKEWLYLVGKDNTKKGLSPKTISVYLASINEYYHFLHTFRYIGLDKSEFPFRKELKINVDSTKKRRTLPETLTMDQVKMIVNECKTYRDKAIILTMVSTGLRIGELCALKVQALDFKNQSIHLRRQYLDLTNGVLKTGERMLKGNAIMFSTLQQYFIFERDRISKCDNVFITLNTRSKEKGLPLTDAAIKKIFSRLRVKTGIDNLHSHILRHTFASYFLMLRKADGNKIGLPILQKLMGHKNVSTTMIYSHLDYTLDELEEGKSFEKFIQDTFQT